MTRTPISRLLTASAIILVPTIASAAGGTPIDEAAQSAVDIGVGLGGLACAAGVIGTCAGGLMRSGAIMAAGATTAVCGGAWAGAPQVVDEIIGGAGGFSLSDLMTSPPDFHTGFQIISSLFWLVG